MLTKSDVIQIINILKKDQKFFLNEAHFQIMFICVLRDLFKDRFQIIPERPIYTYGEKYKSDDGRIDVCLIDRKYNNEQTLIEFKHKTVSKSRQKKEQEVPIYGCNLMSVPSNRGATILQTYDWLKDIQRLEEFVKNNDEIKNGFSIFLTNKEVFWDQSKSTNSKYTKLRFTGESKEYKIEKSSDKTDDEFTNSVGSKRASPILIENDYTNQFSFEIFGKYEPYIYKYIVLEIKK